MWPPGSTPGSCLLPQSHYLDCCKFAVSFETHQLFPTPDCCGRFEGLNSFNYVCVCVDRPCPCRPAHCVLHKLDYMGCEFWGTWDLNSGPLQKQQVLLTTDRPPQPHALATLSPCICIDILEPAYSFLHKKYPSSILTGITLSNNSLIYTSVYLFYTQTVNLLK